VESFYWLFTLFMGVLTVILVPKEQYRPLFWPSLVWGFGVSFLAAIFFGRDVLNLAIYVKDEPFTFLHSPLLLNFAWFETMMLYLNYLPTRKVWYVFPVYVIIFALASTGLQEVFHNAGLLIYKHWNNIFRFLVSLVWFYGAARHYRALSSYDTKNREV
jgi:hypothetical protein